MVKPSLAKAKFLVLAVALATGAASCTSTGDVVLSDDTLPSSPLTLPDGSEAEVTDTTAPDSGDPEDPDQSTGLTTPPATAPPGTVYETASLGAPVLLFDNGVSSLATDGTVTPLANNAVTAASDFQGGVLYQNAAGANANGDTDIYALPLGATEPTAVISGNGDAITLQGVTTLSGAATAIYIRHTDPPVLERAPVTGGPSKVLTTLSGGGAEVESVRVEGPYVAGVWQTETGSNQGWVLYNAASGDRIGGTRIGGTDPCFAASECPDVVTISGDGANIYRIVPSGGSYRLLVTKSANGSQVADIDLEREVDSWFPEQITAQGNAVIISRTQTADPLSATLPALVVNISDETIFQLTETGLVRAID